MGLKLAVLVMSVLAAIAVSGASAADFETDSGPCPEPPGGGQLLLCPTGYVGAPYQVQLESEEGSGCEPYVWYEIVNSVLPGGLSMTRDGLISGVPTGAGFVRFWVWNHDVTAAEGGPSWCQFEDRSEKEFSIPIDPGLAIVNTSIAQATLGQPYTEQLTTREVVSLNPVTGPDVQATWSVLSGALPPGVTLSSDGLLAGTPTTEGSYTFAVRAQNGSPIDTKTYTVNVRQPVVVSSPFGSPRRPSAEVGVRVSKSAKATGGSGTYTWSLSSGALPSGVALDANKGTFAGAPRASGDFAFALTATDSEGRVASLNVDLRVAPRLAITSLRLRAATLGRSYRATLTTVGGITPLKWRLVRGKLPLGLRLSQKLGTIVGKPRRVGTFRVLVEAKDAVGVRSQKLLVLLVTS
jgi:hypothetical protein